MAKRVTTTAKIDRAAAEQFGRDAFADGLDRAPCLNAKYNDWRTATYPESTRAVVELGAEYLRGWDAASLKAV